ncbi:cytochrome P450 [Obelidium mucronatum]|nr:cytochrome P450 [Obelidium mucronatum]
MFGALATGRFADCRDVSIAGAPHHALAGAFIDDNTPVAGYLSLLSYAVYTLLIYPIYCHPLRLVPGPKGNPFSILGKFKELNSREPLDLQFEYYQRYGTIFQYLGLFNPYRLFVLSPAAVKRVLVTHTHIYPKEALPMKFMSEFLGVGLVTATGEIHKRQRYVLNPVFRVSKMQAMIPLFIQSANELKSIWISRIQSDEASGGDGVFVVNDTLKEMGKPTLDVIGRAGFNFNFQAVLGSYGIGDGEDSGDVGGLFAALSAAVDSFGMWNMLVRLYFPFLRYIVPRFINSRIEYENALLTIRSCCKDILDNRKRELAENPNRDEDDGEDLLSAVLRANINEADNEKKLSDEEVMAQVMTFMAAGQETTATALSWALYFLTQSFDTVQDKLRSELVNQMPSPSHDPSLEYISSSSTYLDAVVQESLRLIPPVPWLIRTCGQDDELDGYFIPKGTKVYISPHLLHRAKENWGDDALEFNPDRWSKTNSPLQKQFCAFFPFSAGPRSCIGSRFAMLELKSILAVLVRNFDFRSDTAIVHRTLTAAVFVSAACSPGSRTTRREWNELSSGQKSQYVAALKALAAKPQTGGIDPRTMSLQDFTNLHSRASPYAHGSAQFYPYHRAMTSVFEQALEAVGWNFGAVYLDWPAISQSWWTHEIFTAQYFGPPRSNDPNFCVLEGAFRKGQYNVAVLDADIADRRNYPNPTETCLRRCGNSGSAMTPSEAVNARYAATSYGAFRGDVWSGDDRNDDFVFYHANGHVVWGGDGKNCDMANGSSSPNDPLFWFHHTYVDKVWWRWQNRCPAFKTSYDGPIVNGGPVGQVFISQLVESWGVTVAQVMDTEGDLLCYTYSTSAGDLPMPSITCPPVTVPPTPTSTPSADDLWINAMLIKLVKIKAPEAPSFGGAAAAVGGSSGAVVEDPANAIVLGRDMFNLTSARTATAEISASQRSETLVPTPTVSNSSDSGNATATTTIASAVEPTPTHYDIIQSENSTIVSFLIADKNVTIPTSNTILQVYQTYVETIDADGNFDRLFVEREAVEYVPLEGAPENVVPGQDPCYIAPTLPVPDEWIDMHKLDRQRVRNSEAKERMRIDAWNVENCGPVSK